MINLEEESVYRFENTDNRINKTHQLRSRNNASRSTMEATQIYLWEDIYHCRT